MQKPVSFDDFAQFKDEYDMVIYVDIDCGIICYPELPTKIGQINRERKIISGYCDKPKCIPSNDHHNCSIDIEFTSKIFMIQKSFWDMDPAALFSLNHSFDRDSMSSQYPHTSTHQSTADLNPSFSSLQVIDSETKELHVNFAFFQQHQLPDGQVTETVATVEELNDLWKPVARAGIPPFVMKRSCI